MLTPWLLFFFVIALSFNRSLLFIKDWLVFISLFLFLNFLRGAIYVLIKHYDLPIYSQYIIDFERLFISSGSLASALQLHLTSLGSVTWLERLCTFIYSSHFACFIVVAIIIWAKKPHDFWRYKWSILSCAYISLFIYFLIPTTPPWLAFDQGLLPPVRNIFHNIMAVKFGKLITLLDTNPVAAMPSLHVAFPLVSLLSLLHHFSIRRCWPFIIYFLLVIFSTLLLGAHYIGDILAGISLALICHYVVYFKLKPRKVYTFVVSWIDIATQLNLVVIIFITQMLLKHLLKFMITCG